MDLFDERHRGSEVVLTVGRGHWLNQDHGFTLGRADAMNKAARLGAMGVDTVEVMVSAMVLATVAGTTMGCVAEAKDSMTAWHVRRRACHGNPPVLR